ncbi:MAG: lactate utilization protein [Acidobacteriia bacterium]|nr:lactate utilization protein [Terriglobia bacterium]
MNFPADGSRQPLLAKLRQLCVPASSLSEPPASNDSLQRGRTPQVRLREAVTEATISHLAHELKRLGAEFRTVAGLENLPAAILQLARESHYKRLAVGTDPILKEANLVTGLQNFQDFKLMLNEQTSSPPDQLREMLSLCQLGVTGCDAVIAETGTMVLSHAGFGGRSISLLPECHVVVAVRSQIFISLDEWMDSQSLTPGSFPTCTTLITGPSRTADIEKVLVTGVHGPLRLVLMLVQRGD